ncbi:MAG: segregation and condensation protein A [Cyanobacteriota bacterium]|nr:segregation and condensation protein A [Cyanobacteriota bacterium]
MAEAGARLAIRLLQDAAERGDIDPWDVDVIAVIDGFLDQLRSRITLPVLGRSGTGGSYEHDLAETSEAFLAASVLVGLKAEVLEAATFPPPELDDGGEAFDFDADGQGWLMSPGFSLPSRPERHLWRRPVAPPPLQRPVTLGELIRQLEDIAERLENEELRSRSRNRPKRYSERAAIAQVAALAHREKLPETTAALSRFLLEWDAASDWAGFDDLCGAWAEQVERLRQHDELDCDRPGVFWALLFLTHQGKVELQQNGGLYAPLSLRRLLEAGESRQLPLSAVPDAAAGSAPRPSHETLAA